MITKNILVGKGPNLLNYDILNILIKHEISDFGIEFGSRFLDFRFSGFQI